MEQVELLDQHRICPLRVIELNIEEGEMLLRGDGERVKHPTTVYVLSVLVCASVC